MGNATIEKRVRRALASAGFDRTAVAVDRGIVTLCGTVASYDEYVACGLRAGGIAGVVGVVNDLAYPGKKPVERRQGSDELLDPADVVVVGGGVVGCCIARELSRFRLDVALVEKAEDVACGTSKANNAMVHTGIGEKTGTLKQRLCVEGHRHYPEMTAHLDVPFEQSGLWIVTTRDSYQRTRMPTFLQYLMLRYVIPRIVGRRGKKLGIPMQRVSRDELLQREPEVTDRVLAAVFSPTYGVTCPYLFTISLAENAVANGVRLMLRTEVVDIETKEGAVTSVVTTNGTIPTTWVVNAAGLYADAVAGMAVAREYTIHPKKGATLLFDRTASASINHSMSWLTFPRTEHYKGGGLMLTVSGNLQWGPTLTAVEDREDTTVTAQDIATIFERYAPIAPRFPKNAVIAYFSGLRAASFTQDFIIRPARDVRGFIHVAGIQSPGLAAAPAIARMVVDILKEEGLFLEEKDDFNPRRKAPPVVAELSDAQRAAAVARNPRYGRVVCRCEGVTEGEIVDAIHAPVPARSMDAVKRRSRAGMGRCQGGFCLPEMARILARETGVPLEEIVKNEPDSPLFLGRAKCLLERKHGR
jgi:glycerol-3-phosphate dehydrogenase